MKAVRFSHTDVHTRSQHMCIDGDIKNVGAYKCVCLRANGIVAAMTYFHEVPRPMIHILDREGNAEYITRTNRFSPDGSPS